MLGFGTYIRAQRGRLSEDSKDFSVRKVAMKIGVEPAFLSKVEREIVSPPSEGKIIALAEVLGEDQDVLLAMAGKVSSDLLKVIKDRPALFAELIRRLKSEPDHAVLRIVREVKDGQW
jgi:transcriptional regulator with XRE-family HTH domain